KMVHGQPLIPQWRRVWRATLHQQLQRRSRALLQYQLPGTDCDNVHASGDRIGRKGHGRVHLLGRSGEHEAHGKPPGNLVRRRLQLLGSSQGRLVLMKTAREFGFSLIELMIGLAIAGLLVMLALPGYSTWIADAQIRNAAESIASGVRFAQAEAIRQNTTVEFLLTPTPGTGGWVAELIDRTTCNPVPPVAQAGTFKEGADKVAFATRDVTGAVGGVRVTFTSLGDRLRDAAGNIRNCDGSEMLAEVRITSTVAGSRNLNVVIFGGASAVAGQGNRSGIKICDPQANIKFGNNDPKACPV